jgi:hypothetical protein
VWPAATCFTPGTRRRRDSNSKERSFQLGDGAGLLAISPLDALAFAGAAFGLLGAWAGVSDTRRTVFALPSEDGRYLSTQRALVNHGADAFDLQITIPLRTIRPNARLDADITTWPAAPKKSPVWSARLSRTSHMRRSELRLHGRDERIFGQPMLNDRGAPERRIDPALEVVLERQQCSGCAQDQKKGGGDQTKDEVNFKENIAHYSGGCGHEASF